jgi:hypothetical protein
MPQMAQELQSQGRNGDSIMVHMGPEEVGGLQALARSQGTSLTINPMTGMPEAFSLGKFFKKMLPTLLGAGLAATGVGAPLAAGIVGLGSTALTGSLKKGLMAGLGAYGGASLAGAAGLGGKIGGGNAFGLLSDKAGILGANMGAGIGSGAATIGQVAGQTAAQGAAQAGAGNIFTPISETALGASANMVPTSQTLAAQFAGNAAGTVAAPTIGAGISPFATNASTIVGNTLANAPAVAPGATGFFGKFAETSRAGLPGMLSKYAPYAAAAGLATPFMSSPKYEESGAINNSYQGPYRYEDRPAQFASSTDELLNSSAERDYFGVDQPGVYNMQSQLVQPGSQTPIGTPIVQSFLNPNAKKNEPMYSFREVPYGMEAPPLTYEQYAQMMGSRGMFGLPGRAKGGELPLDDGAFIVDARTVSEMGNGSSNAGIERLAKLGGAPIRGPGDGVSDSIPARIGGDQKARVARDEVKFSRDAVERLGGGSHKKGVSKLYKLMDKAHKARKKAGRGSDTKLAAGLGAL